MKYGRWVEKVWQGICAEAQQGPMGPKWNALVSDRFLEALDIFNLLLLAREVQESLLTAVDQAASLLQDKGVYSLDDNDVTLTDLGLRYVGFSPLHLWSAAEVSERAGQFLAEAAMRLQVISSDDSFIMIKSPNTIEVRGLFDELGWEYSKEYWKRLKRELLGYFLIEPVRSGDDPIIRITVRGMLFASYAD